VDRGRKSRALEKGGRKGVEVGGGKEGDTMIQDYQRLGG